MSFVDKQNDRLGRSFDFVNHAFESTLEFAFDAGTGLQQPHVQRQQFNAFQRLRHLPRRNTRGQAFDDGRFTDTRFTHNNRVVFAASSKDVNHLPDRVVAAQHRIEFTVAGLLGKVVGKALQQELTRRSRFTGVRQLFLGQRELFQAVDIQFGEQQLVTTARVAHRVTQQRENQCRLFDLGVAQFKVGNQQGILQPLHQFRGEHRVARSAVLNPGLQSCTEFAGVYIGIQQSAGKQALGTFQQTQQQVFDEDLAAATRHTTFGRAFQVTTGFGIQRLDQLLQVEVDHLSSVLNEFCCPVSPRRPLFHGRASWSIPGGKRFARLYATRESVPGAASGECRSRADHAG